MSRVLFFCIITVASQHDYELPTGRSIIVVSPNTQNCKSENIAGSLEIGNPFGFEHQFTFNKEDVKILSWDIFSGKNHILVFELKEVKIN